MTLHRPIRAVGCLVAAVVIGAACTSNTGPASPSTLITPSAAATTAASPSSSPAHIDELTVWVPTGTPDSYTNRFYAWADAVGTKVNIVEIAATYETNVLTKWTAGERPDVVKWSQLAAYQLNPNENLIDLADRPFVSHLISPDLMLATAGHKYGLVDNFPSVFGLTYNKKVLADAGVTPPENFAQLLAACQTLKAKGITPLYAAGGDQWPLQDYQNPLLADLTGDPAIVAGLNANTTRWTDPRFLPAIQALAQLRDDACFNKDAVTAPGAQMGPALLAGDVAMALQGDYHWFSVQPEDFASTDATIGFGPFSMSGNAVSYTASGSFMFVKSSDPARNEALIGLVDYLMGDGYQAWLTKNDFYPVLKGYSPPEGGLGIVKSAYEATLDKGVQAYNHIALDQAGDYPDLQGLLNNQMTPEEFLQKMDERWQAAGKRIGLPGF